VEVPAPLSLPIVQIREMAAVAIDDQQMIGRIKRSDSAQKRHLRRLLPFCRSRAENVRRFCPRPAAPRDNPEVSKSLLPLTISRKVNWFVGESWFRQRFKFTCSPSPPLTIACFAPLERFRRGRRPRATLVPRFALGYRLAGLWPFPEDGLYLRPGRNEGVSRSFASAHISLKLPR